jgi:Tol biopolymer transport system component
VAHTGGVPAVVGGTNRRWAWIAVALGAWIVCGVHLVARGLQRGDITDVAMSPYHAVLYSGLLALAVVSLWLVARALQRGQGWRRSFPDGYGSLGAGLVVVVLGLLGDVGWREGVGISDGGIDNFIAPSRVVIFVGFSLIAMAPLRASLRAGEDRRLGWPAAISAGLLTASIAGVTPFNPIVNPRLEQLPDTVEDNREVWLMDADGGRQTRLLERADGVDLDTPVWSPDGSRIAYARFESNGDDLPVGDHDIWVVNSDGSDARPLATGPTWQWFPRWSPDGAWIAYTDEARGGPWLESGPVGPDLGAGPAGPAFPGANVPSLPEANLWRVRVDGSGVPIRITNNAGDDRSGSWSPDGTRLAFDSTRDGNTQIYVVDADGSNTSRLTTTPGADWSTSWSPDGTKIAFTSDRSGLPQIWVMDADGGAATQLTDDATGGLWPSWSRDGARIVYTSWRTGSQQVWSIAADGSDARNLSRSEGTIDAEWDGSWGPDGRIAFTRVGAPPPDYLSIVREDLGVASLWLSALVLGLVTALLVRTRPPFGAVVVALGISTLLAATQVDGWRFVPAAVIVGFIVDLLLRPTPVDRRVAVAASAAAVGLVVVVAGTVDRTTAIGWSPTMVLGIALAVGVAGWAIGALVERHSFGRDIGEASTADSAE